MVAKLKSTSGESIAETLIAVLIAAFALLMLAGTINSASNIITKSQNTLTEYYTSNNKLAERPTDSGNGVTVSDGTITVDSGSSLDSWSVYFFTVNSNIGSKTLKSYGMK